MNWLLAFVAAIVGAGMAESRTLFGAVVAFVLVMMMFAQNRLRRDADVSAKEISSLKARLASLLAARPDPVVPTSEFRSAAVPQAKTVPANKPDGLASGVESTIAVDPARPAPTPPPLPGTARPVGETAESDRGPAASASPRAPSEPAWDARIIASVKRWFTEGNVPVKIGVLVLMFGVGAALKLAAEKGYFTLSIEARLIVIAIAALAGLALGWRERIRKPAFGLSLQGGAIGVLLLTVFAAYRLYSLLPSGLAFTMVVVLVAGSAALSLLQKNMSLAVLGFLGGYLAPVIISTGSADHIALFTYYAVLNAAVFAISWRQSWRLLNLLGFVFTFAVGTAWGKQYYRPELFATVEPFLVLFFVFYILIGLLYVLRQTEHRRPWVDGTLVFGTPLVAFPLQAAMLKHDRIGMALSALVVALVYAGLVAWLRNRRGERLLTEAYAALALGFATLAVPLAFSASTTASVWALEGAGVAWLGLRQGRKFPWLAGLALQWLAAGAYVMSASKNAVPVPADAMLLLNAQWLGAAILSFSGFALALIHDRHRPIFGLPLMLFAWGVLWWAVGAITQLDDAGRSMVGEWPFITLYLAMSSIAATFLAHRLSWPRLRWLGVLVALCGFALVLAADGEYGSPFAQASLAFWLVFGIAQCYALWQGKTDDSRTLPILHVSLLWTLALGLTMQLKDLMDVQQLAQGWQFLALIAPVAVMTLGLWRRPQWFAWPAAGAFGDRYRIGWFAPAMLLLSAAFVFGLFLDGSAVPLAFVPLLNPLELGLLAVAAMVLALGAEVPQLRSLRAAWPLPAFAFVTMATLRAVHHLHGEPWTEAILDSGFSQASLTVVWSLLGVAAWVLGSLRRDRTVWMGGAVLMGIVLLKLLFVDRSYMGNLPGIVSFMAVGLLLVGVGYVAPSPPRTPASGESR